MNLRRFLLAGAVLSAAAGAVPQARSADYATAVNDLKPVLWYRLSTTNLVPTELPAANAGSLGAAANGEYQSMAATRGVAGAIAGDADTAVNIVGSTGQQVVVPYSAAYNPDGPFSVEFWARPANADGGNHTAAISMVNGQNPASGDDRSGWCIRAVGDAWQFVLGFDHSDGATFYGTTLAAGGTVSAGAWQHVVAVYSGAAVTLYVNGVSVATDAPGKPMLPNRFGPLLLGDRGYTGWDFNGDLDEFAVYTSALTAAEVKSHYDSGVNAGRSKAYADLVREKNPPLYLRLGEPSLQLPIAVNSGSLGAAGNGVFLAGTTPGMAGPQSPAVNGFDATNRAVAFNGKAGSVSLPGPNLQLDAATFVCWIRRDGDQPARAGILHNRGPNTKATGLGFQDAGNALSYNWEDHGETYNFNPGFVPPDGAWTFVAVSIESAQAVMYMGTAAGLVAATNTFTHDTHDFSGATIELGYDNYQTTRVMKGLFDEFAMFDKTLDATQIRGLYNAALPAILGVRRTPADPVYEGLPVAFTASVAGTAPITYQWRRNGSPLSGQTTATLSLASVVPGDAADYDVVVTTGGKTLTSAPSTLAIQSSAPILTSKPAPAARFLNGRATFTVAAAGSQPMSYVWKHGGTVIPGATAATLVLDDLQAADAGDYTVTVTNPLGSSDATASLALATPTKFASAATEVGPIGYWRLDESTGTTAYDYWGGRDGTRNAGVTSGLAGPRPSAVAGFEADNNAYDFNGTGGEVDVPALNLNKATITIVAWIKPTGTPDDYDGIVFSRGGNTVAGLDFQVGGQLGYHWNDTASSYGWGSGLTPTADRWNFVALVVEPSQATIYLDPGTGLESSVNTVDHSPEEFNGTLRFGADGNGSRFYKGGIDDVVIYDRALSTAEITKLRNAGIQGAYTPAAPAIAEQPKADTVMAGTRATLSARITGGVPLSYQWRKDGQDLPGAIRARLVFESPTPADSGSYQLVVTQGTKTVSSTPVQFTVKPVPSYLDATDSLVTHLKFDGNYTDSSGRNHNGEAKGQPSIIAGKVGTGALHYSTEVSGNAVSAANYVSLGSPADLKFGTSSFTIAFWIRFSGGPGDLPFLCNNADSYGGAGFVFAPSYNTGSWSWSLNDGASPVGWPGVAAQYGNEAGFANSINDGQWHHLAFVADRAGELATWTDGVKVHTKTLAGLTFNPDTDLPVTIGQGGNGDYAVPGGFDMDDLGIWRRVLTTYEAQALYVVGNLGRSFDTQGPAEVRLTVGLNAARVTLGWSAGTLEAADAVTGPWSAVAGANAPSHVVDASAPRKFYRVKVSN